jgi:adenosylcobyric acid synthase
MHRAGRAVMIQGTASSVGKSLLVAGLCRLLRQDGYRVAPFKAQNMSNNSFVTRTGEEMGRAQVVQAEAAGVEPDVRMNPVLLKPEADHRSQVVAMGRPAFTLHAGEFNTRKAELWPLVTRALDELRATYDVVVIEGAGSPAEINLRAGDIVNMRVALHAAAPVLLVGDIDRGGVFAHLYGTLALLEPNERVLVRGLVINKFRGDLALLEPGLRMLEERTGVPVLGVVPYLHDLRIADEDAADLEGDRPSPPPPSEVCGVPPQRSVGTPISPRRGSARTPRREPTLGEGWPAGRGEGPLDIAVIRLPRIANFDDFDPLAAEPDVRLRYVDRVGDLGRPDLLILPGTKATIADLAWLRKRGLAGAVQAAAKRGAAVLGICGGYQMLGTEVRDPRHVESTEDAAPGLGLLPVVTDFEPVKATHQVETEVCTDRGLFAGCAGLTARGYEIHMGRSRAAGGPVFALRRRSGGPCDDHDGTTDRGGWVAGTYLHGLFDNDALRAAMLRNLAARAGKAYRPGVPIDRAAEYDRLAMVLRDALDVGRLREIVGLEAAWAR